MSDLQLMGLTFDADFSAALPRLEQKMRLRGLEPSEFLLTKSLSNWQPYPGVSVLGVSYNYHVNVAGEIFDVTFPDDMKFLDYFTGLCLAPDKGDAQAGLFERLKEWLASKPSC